ncbi:fumarate lyase superfamily protein [Schizosaccharomyces cryophilus OY26]|uniref:Fumarate lyase superfamily protein n=1 Tax=Schizosaccharomyces cryophilus (strain OY26 / ATCC MYA-4695 / CBS 11777 / NBRC 106824 / NRRL Y48691) TaxID=653667 RepID=S9XBK6_SCHCR|nr:fumarate lyase superfamily protein [Schizosaccharomyces cryophilus OY26]EPY51181.1 fumarate lyase superfamily protein [Schizosaccharomyces cryophilus OY26]
MPTSVFDSLVFRGIFGEAKISQIWSDENRTQQYLNWESALAKAESSLGLIPQEAAEEIGRVCQVKNIDFQRLEDETLTIGYPVLGVVHQVAKLCKGDAGKYCHWGATTQDVTDTATIQQILESLEVIRGYLDKAIELTEALARKYKDTPMVGRSNLQQAVPITFGFKMARLLCTFHRHIKRLDELVPRLSVVEFGGACGTLASLGNKGLKVQELLAKELGLSPPEIAWHTERDRIAEAGCFLGLVTGTLGKFALDVKLMMQNEIGEVNEPYIANRGSSSTMPQKRNPISCVYITACVSCVRQKVAALLDAMVEDHERSTGTWEIEWIVLPEIFSLTAGALKQTVFVLQGLEVNPERMKANLSLTKGLISSEAVMMGLASFLGRDEAHDLIYSLCKKANEENQSLEEVLLQEKKITDHLTREQVLNLTNPANYLGQTLEMIDLVLK